MRTLTSTPKQSSNWSKKFLQWKDDLLHLVYPGTCLICAQELTSHANNLCPICDSNLKYTYFENFADASEMDKLFWGRIPLMSTCAFLHFEQDSSTQEILHAIKYKGKKELAITMGQRFGEKLATNEAKFGTIQALIPVPLHPKKKFIRGYNQSEMIAQGIGSALEIDVITDFLSKGKHTESQTKKNKFMRWDNVSEVFLVDASKYAHLQHIALVDDVVTTGSTLEAAIQKILEVLPHIQVSVLSLAIAK